ncbi:hypothetical protein ANN_05071 [Periplaneta americana]|uniref:Carboxypeptidase n=1 Tax=Periplaneta americana TaxID=6978 RepID=A0ABQ8TBU8_PERAM|nr:hypothetical protein ANN_05071 [Periplaneta americana]
MWSVVVLLLLVVGATPGLGLLILPSQNISSRLLAEEGEVEVTFTEEEVGSPLILTPYVQSGKVEEAQNLSAVRGGPFSDDIPSYSGYFTVNENFNSNMFFWFFPAENDYENAPIVLWLQGGPGASSLSGLFYEIGPYHISENGSSLLKNPYSWHKNHSLIFFENPVGTGFSFSNFEGYAQNEDQVAAQLYSAITQFFTMFPQLQSLPFFIAGESYAGKYVPALAYTIHKQNPTAQLKINLQGIAVGNGLSDPPSQYKYSDLLYQIGLVDTSTYIMMQAQEKVISKLLQEDKSFDAWSMNLLTAQDSNTFVSNYNFLKEPESLDDMFYNLNEFMQQIEVRKAIHVGNTNFSIINNIVYDVLAPNDWATSVRPWLEELIDNYRVLYYSGQLDIIVAYVLSVNMYNKLEFSKATEYREAKRLLWNVNGRLAGFMKTGGNFTEVLVRNAGHMVPQDQPEWAFDLINRFTRNKMTEGLN